MSWLARSLANSLRLDPDDDPLNDVVSPPSSSAPARPPPPPPAPAIPDDTQSPEEAQSRGVKEDLSELGETLTRQFWGVASFLAPPPSDLSDHSGSGAEEGSPDSDGGIRDEFAEIGGRFRTGVSELSRMASNLITVEEQEEEEELEEETEVEIAEDEEEEVAEGNEKFVEYYDGEDYDDDGDDPVVVGITHEVLAFARNIAMHPETWLDFPLDEEEDTEDFDMSIAQREHAFAIEQFSPRLAALRIELCPFHMSLGYFWKVYFVLLHSRLNKQDAESLSTPQVMAARAKWMQELHKQTKPDPGYSARSVSHFRDESNSLDEENDFYHSENMPLWSFSSEPTRDYETEKHPFVSTEMPLIDKSVIEEEQDSKSNVFYSPVGPSSKTLAVDFAEEDDDWPEEEGLELQGYETNITMGNEEDVSFSDLENDADLSLPKKPNTISKDYEASVKKT